MYELAWFVLKKKFLERWKFYTRYIMILCSLWILDHQKKISFKLEKKGNNEKQKY
jgi:hypothetical protein